MAPPSLKVQPAVEQWSAAPADAAEPCCCGEQPLVASPLPASPPPASPPPASLPPVSPPRDAPSASAKARGAQAGEEALAAEAVHGRGGVPDFAGRWVASDARRELACVAVMGLLLLYLLRRLLPLLLLFVAIATVWSMRRSGYWRRRGVPGPAPLPLVGNLWPLLCLRRSPGELIAALYRAAPTPDAPYIGFFILDKPCLLLRDPALIKRVLVADFAAWDARHARADAAVDPAGAASLFMLHGAAWQVTRRALSPAFSTRRLRMAFPCVERRARALADYVHEAGGRPLRTKDVVARAFTDLAADSLFGLEARALREGDAAPVRAFGRRIFGFSLARAVDILALFFVPALVRPLRVRFFQRHSSAFFERLFRTALRERRLRHDQRQHRDLLDDILDVPRRAQAAAPLGALPDVVGTEAHAAGQAMVFLTAGFETTGTTVSVALFELARCPAAQAKLRAELRAARARHGALHYDCVNDAPFLAMVVQEALRLYPTLPYLDRRCARAYALPDGPVLEAGTPLFVPVMALHRDERLYPQPDAFVPERWATPTDPPQLFLPFGAGPRTCIGMRFALLAVKVVLAHLMLRFEVLPCAETPPQLTVSPFGLFLKFFGGIPLQFRALEDPASHAALDALS